MRQVVAPRSLGKFFDVHPPKNWRAASIGQMDFFTDSDRAQPRLNFMSGPHDLVASDWSGSTANLAPDAAVMPSARGLTQQEIMRQHVSNRYQDDSYMVKARVNIYTNSIKNLIMTKGFQGWSKLLSDVGYLKHEIDERIGPDGSVSFPKALSAVNKDRLALDTAMDNIAAWFETDAGRVYTVVMGPEALVELENILYPPPKPKNN